MKWNGKIITVEEKYLMHINVIVKWLWNHTLCCALCVLCCGGKVTIGRYNLACYCVFVILVLVILAIYVIHLKATNVWNIFIYFIVNSIGTSSTRKYQLIQWNALRCCIQQNTINGFLSDTCIFYKNLTVTATMTLMFTMLMLSLIWIKQR